MARQPKQVEILARYTHKTEGKPNGTVSYLVRSSDGKSTYCTTIINGQASGCSCPSRSPKGCYHKNQLENKEQQRKEVAQQFSAKSAPSWLINLVSTSKLVAPKQVVELPAGVAPINGTLHVKGPALAKTTDISTKGALTTNRGFSLLKVS